MRAVACRFSFLVVLALLAAGGGIAQACYSGLVLIPTAETVGADQFSLDLQVDGSFPRQATDTYIINTEFGFGPRFEAGVDFDLSEEAESRTFFNAKYLLTEDREKAPALALGITNVAEGVQAVPYLVMSHDFQSLRGHLGVGRFEDKNRWFAGMDRGIAENLTFMADYTSGAENASSVGLNYEFNDCWSVCLGAMFPNEGGESGFSFHLAWATPYRKSAEAK
jgi:hypothetical protein